MAEAEEESVPVERLPRMVRCATCNAVIEVPHRHFDEVNESNCADFPGECGLPDDD